MGGGGGGCWGAVQVALLRGAALGRLQAQRGFPSALCCGVCWAPAAVAHRGVGSRVLLNNSAFPGRGRGGLTPPPPGPGFHCGKKGDLQKDILIWAVLVHTLLNFWVPGPPPPFSKTLALPRLQGAWVEHPPPPPTRGLVPNAPPPPTSGGERTGQPHAAGARPPSSPASLVQ